jgi:hypothetical protein
MVPETAPTAKSTAAARPQRFASLSAGLNSSWARAAFSEL